MHCLKNWPAMASSTQESNPKQWQYCQFGTPSNKISRGQENCHGRADCLRSRSSSREGTTRERNLNNKAVGVEVALRLFHMG